MNPKRGLLIAGNWKMNLGPAETRSFFAQLTQLCSSSLTPGETLTYQQGKIRAALFVPAVSFSAALEAQSALPLPIRIGAQNLHWETRGAYTGEISGPMAKALGIEWSLVGHSERRQYFGETNVTAHKRTESLLGQSFTVVSCLGENLAERQAKKTESLLKEQFLNSIGGSCAAHAASQRLVIAYEPVWAIGTGLTPTMEEIEATHAFLREQIRQRWDEATAQSTLLLYGGSVTPQNIDSILKCPNVDGVLVGGASVQAESFFSLLQKASQAL